MPLYGGEIYQRRLRTARAEPCSVAGSSMPLMGGARGMRQLHLDTASAPPGVSLLPGRLRFRPAALHGKPCPPLSRARCSISAGGRLDVWATQRPSVRAAAPGTVSHVPTLFTRPGAVRWQHHGTGLDAGTGIRNESRCRERAHGLPRTPRVVASKDSELPAPGSLPPRTLSSLPRGRCLASQVRKLPRLPLGGPAHPRGFLRTANSRLLHLRGCQRCAASLSRLPWRINHSVEHAR